MRAERTAVGEVRLLEVARRPRLLVASVDRGRREPVTVISSEASARRSRPSRARPRGDHRLLREEQRQPARDRHAGRPFLQEQRGSDQLEPEGCQGRPARRVRPARRASRVRPVAGATGPSGAPGHRADGLAGRDRPDGCTGATGSGCDRSQARLVPPARRARRVRRVRPAHRADGLAGRHRRDRRDGRHRLAGLDGPDGPDGRDRRSGRDRSAGPTGATGANGPPGGPTVISGAVTFVDPADTLASSESAASRTSSRPPAAPPLRFRPPGPFRDSGAI